MANNILIGRPINGISVNGLEYVLTDDSSDLRRFRDEEEARAFLQEQGFTEEDMEAIRFVEDNEEEEYDIVKTSSLM